MFQEYDLVRLKAPISSLAVATDALGTIVMVYDALRAYEVEFADDRGNTLALVTLQEDEIVRVHRINLDEKAH